MQQPLLSQTYMAFAIHSDTLTCAGSLLLDSMLSGGPCEPKEFPSFHGGVRKNESDPHESSFEFVRRVQIYLNPEDSSPRQLHSPPMMRDESSVELVLYAGSSMPSPLRRIPIRNDRNHSLRSPAKSPDPQAPHRLQPDWYSYYCLLRRRLLRFSLELIFRQGLLTRLNARHNH